jgi:predicted enzyme related to lactoylglutathione lyase
MAAHPIVHIEIPANNTKEAAQFYADMFGWELQHAPNFDYWMFRAGDGPGGGFVKIGETDATNQGQYKPDSLLVYVDSDDIDADLAKVESLGGKTLVPKTEIPGTGWFGIFTDPSGNRVALYTNMQPQS